MLIPQKLRSYKFYNMITYIYCIAEFFQNVTQYILDCYPTIIVLIHNKKIRVYYIKTNFLIKRVYIIKLINTNITN